MPSVASAIAAVTDGITDAPSHLRTKRMDSKGSPLVGVQGAKPPGGVWGGAPALLHTTAAPCAWAGDIAYHVR
jgi:hypothetical protein